MYARGKPEYCFACVDIVVLFASCPIPSYRKAMIIGEMAVSGSEAF